MRKTKKELLEKKGWKVGSVDEFLDLTPEESAYIEMKVRLSEQLRQRRQRKRLSQVEFAKLNRASPGWPRWRAAIHLSLSIC